MTYRSASNHQFDLSPLRANKLRELLDYALKRTQPVVRSQSLKEVLHDALLILTTKVLLQLGNNLLLVRNGERRRMEDDGELGVLLEYIGEGVERFGRGVEGAGFDGRGVLHEKSVSERFSSHCVFPHHSPIVTYCQLGGGKGARTRALA